MILKKDEMEELDKVFELARELAEWFSFMKHEDVFSEELIPYLK